ncbi:MAG: LD-carboxypeptidase, partial [Synechococcaceae bacterium WB6_1B_055]|nr:LD-carboxypeptidase [Synechococcaceae bacterium WB6_1B_055]
MKARIVAPSSALGELKNLQAGLELLGSWGIQLELPQIANRRWGYLAGSDGQRLADFDATADLWACARGGWGAARLLELGWQPPEGLLLGFSD